MDRARELESVCEAPAVPSEVVITLSVHVTGGSVRGEADVVLVDVDSSGVAKKSEDKGLFKAGLNAHAALQESGVSS